MPGELNKVADALSRAPADLLENLHYVNVNQPDLVESFIQFYLIATYLRLQVPQSKLIQRQTFKVVLY